MKNFITYVFLCVAVVISAQSDTYTPLPASPSTIQQYKEIATVYNAQLPSFYNQLSPQERIMIYYLFRASLPGNRILADQYHRDAVEITEMCEYILLHADKIKKDLPLPIETFLEEMQMWLVYLCINHCQYFMREFVDHKRVPSSLQLQTITKENLILILEALDRPDAKEKIERLYPAIFEKNIEPTVTVPGSIEKSAVNIYAKDFTDQDFMNILPEKQHALNAYFFIDKENNLRIPQIQKYKIGGKYDQELQVSYYWLTKAHQLAQENPDFFDIHFTKSLEYLLLFLQTGDEENFKQHSIEWLQSNSRIDYVFGFIENYRDPLSYRGFFEAEATIKYLDMSSLRPALLSIEEQFPFPSYLKRDTSKAAEFNVSMNISAFTAGELGPMQSVAAYCLPNYEEIRAKFGSKQILYYRGENVLQKFNFDLYKKLFYLSDHIAWHEEYDPEFLIGRDIANIHVLLHETIGHGSGTLYRHIVQKENLALLQDKNLQEGDEIEVTSANVALLLSPYISTLEELRAEILALYASVENYDDIVAMGLLHKWKEKISKSKMQELFIIDMVSSGLRWLARQPLDAKQMTGDHARANYIIMNYLLEGKGIALREEKVYSDDKTYSVLGFEIIDLEKTREDIKKLALLVQTIKSTADHTLCKDLIETYGITIQNPQHIRIGKENYQAILHDIQAFAMIYPHFTCIKDPQTQKIIEIQASWPKSIVEQQLHYAEIALSTD